MPARFSSWQKWLYYAAVLRFQQEISPGLMIRVKNEDVVESPLCQGLLFGAYAHLELLFDGGRPLRVRMSTSSRASSALSVEKGTEGLFSNQQLLLVKTPPSPFPPFFPLDS